MPDFGSGELRGPRGTPTVTFDDDGTHRLSIDYELDAAYGEPVDHNA